MVVKYFIFLTIIGVAIALPPGDIVDEKYNRILPLNTDNSKKQLEKVVETTVKQDVVEPNGQKLGKDFIKRIQSIVNEFIIRLNEIVKENPEFLSDSFRSFNGKEKRGLFSMALDFLKDFGLTEVAKGVIKDVAGTGIEKLGSILKDFLDGDAKNIDKLPSIELDWDD